MPDISSAILLISNATILEARAVEVIEVWMLEGGKSRDSSIRVECDKSCEEVNLEFVKRRCVLRHSHAAELREGRFEIVKLEGVWPVVFVRRTQYLENFEDLIDLRITDEKRTALDHLCENAACGPKIDTETVGLLTEEDLGAAVPECDDLVRISFNGQAECTRKTKVCKLDH